MGPVPPGETRSGIRQGAEQSRRRQQAELVAAWVGRFDSLSDRISRSSSNYSTGETVPAAIVRNGSSLPIWDVEVRWIAKEGPVLNEVMSFATIPPEDDAAWEVPDFLPNDAQPSLMVAITFRDAAMVWWSRDEHGILEQLDSPSLPERDRR
jgi:hypothetical protein